MIVAFEWRYRVLSVLPTSSSDTCIGFGVPSGPSDIRGFVGGEDGAYMVVFPPWRRVVSDAELGWNFDRRGRRVGREQQIRAL
jgi:hypothetical protein